MADSGNHRIQILTSTGQFITKFGEKELKNTYGVCLTSDGNIAVCSGGEKVGVKVFTQDGELIIQFNDSKRKERPYFVTYGSQKYFVTYVDDHKVSVFNREGIPLYSFGECGQGDGQFKTPYGVVIDSSNKVLVCDSANLYDRRSVFTQDRNSGCWLGTVH